MTAIVSPQVLAVLAVVERRMRVVVGRVVGSVDQVEHVVVGTEDGSGGSVDRIGAAHGRGVGVVYEFQLMLLITVRAGDQRHTATVEQVESAAEMLAAVREHAGEADALVSAAAISDYTVARADEKIRSGQAGLTLDLEPTPKLIDTVRADHPDLPIVGFKVESAGGDEGLLTRARDLLERVDLAFVVANDASVMGDAETRALLVERDDHDEYTGDKPGLGVAVAEKLAAKLGEQPYGAE